MIYKYVPPERTDILEDLRVRFTQPVCFNDPFDMHPSFDLMSKKDISELPPHPSGEGYRLTPDACRKMAEFAMASMTPVEGSGAFSLDNNTLARSALNRTFGVLCLSETATNLLMWAHYAECHRGFVLGFDENHEFFKSPHEPALALARVQYAKERPVRSITTLEDPAVFFTKSTEWSYERELRFIERLERRATVKNTASGPVYLFSLSPATIRAVILGASMSADVGCKIRAICERRELAHVRIYQASLSRELFELESHPELEGWPNAGRARAPSAR